MDDITKNHKIKKLSERRKLLGKWTERERHPDKERQTEFVLHTK